MKRKDHVFTLSGEPGHRSKIACLLVLMAAIAALTAAPVQAAPSAPTSAGVQGLGVLGTPAGHASAGVGKSRLVQDPQWVALKLANKIQRPGYSSTATQGVQPECGSPCIPSTYTLSYSSTQSVREPLGSVPGTYNCTNDAGGHCYVDLYMWGLCGPGATTVALYYWNRPVFSYSNGSWFSDPHTSTYWNNTDGRAYLMYLATQSYPPSFISAGEETYFGYSSDITYNTDVRDTLNWEASGHAGNWSTYFYVYLSYNGLSASTLNADTTVDIAVYHAPVVVDLNAQRLPNWTNNNGVTSHFVSIIGYNNVNGTYTYIDTCGQGCNNKGSSNGVYTVSQSTLYTAIEQNNGNGAVIE